MNARLVSGCVRLAAAAFALSPALALADGTEALGPASVTIAEGTGTLAAGTGTVTQPGVIDLDVPAGATVKQVLLYWNQFNVLPSDGDDTVSVNGQSVTGDLIGGPSTFYFDVSDTVFRADITALGLVSPGANELSITDLDTSWDNSGAGVLVVIDDGGPLATIDVRDGSDLAYYGFQAPHNTTAPVDYTFDAADVDRDAQITLFVGSVEGPNHPTAIDVTIDGDLTTYTDLLGSNDGEFWDTLGLDVTIPAGATALTVHVDSRSDGSGNQPASFTWVGSTLTITGLEPPAPTGDEGCAEYFWLFHLYQWRPTSYSPWDDFDSVFGTDYFHYYTPLWYTLAIHPWNQRQALARLGTTALLNAAHPDIDFPLTEDDVTTIVQGGDIQSLRDLRDLNLMCPLDYGYGGGGGGGGCSH